MIKKLKRYFLITLFCFFVYLDADYNVFPLDTDYHTELSLKRKIDQYHRRYRKNFQYRVLTQTETDKKDIYLISVTENKDKVFKDKPNILIIGQIHSEEPIGLEISLKFIEFLTENKSHNLLKSYNFYIIPTLNPEGFSLVNGGISNFHRKNKKDTNKNGQFDIVIDGVDLNRNFPFNWNIDENTCPENRYYAGEYPASEIEVQSLISFFEENHIFLTINYHSSFNGAYNEKIFFPYHWEEKKSPHYDIMKFIADSFAENLPKDYLTGDNVNTFYDVHTLRTSKVGYLRDYVYHEFTSLAFDIEVGGINDRGQSVVFPPNFKLKEIIEKNIISLNHTLTVISNNIHKGLLINEGQPLRLFSGIEDSGRIRKPFRTNEYGYFFIYNPLNQRSFNILVEPETKGQRVFLYNSRNRNTQIFNIR